MSVTDRATRPRSPRHRRMPGAQRLSNLKARPAPAVIILLGIALEVVVVVRGDRSKILIAGFLVFCGLVYVSHRSPKAILILWVISVAAVPPWFFYRGSITPSVIVSAAIVVGRRGLPKTGRTAADWAVILLCVFSGLGAYLGGGPHVLLRTVLLQWGLAYWAARRLGAVINHESMGRVMTQVGVVLSLIAIPQSLVGFNLSDLPVYSHGVVEQGVDWQALQTRGGFTRAELTFGHSIAFGSVMVICLAFSLRPPITRWRWLWALIIVGGVFSSFSRGPLLGAALVIFLAIIVSPMSNTARAFYAVVFAGVGLWIAKVFTDISTANGGEQEFGGDALYRENLLHLMSTVRPIGIANGFTAGGKGTAVSFDGFSSIDNALLYVGLYVGGIAAIMYFIPTIWVLVSAIRRGWRPIDIAFVAQGLILFTVAPITQYQDFYWFFAGLAVSRVAQPRDPPLQLGLKLDTVQGQP